VVRPTTPLLSKPGIRAAALAIVDRDGLDGLSMRKLATALKVSAPALYFHYQTKDQLLDDVASEIMEQVDPIFYGDPRTAAMKVLGGS